MIVCRHNFCRKYVAMYPVGRDSVIGSTNKEKELRTLLSLMAAG
jgi:hypothetical protein